MNEISIDEVSKRAIHRHGVELYNTEDALILVKLCQQLSLPILGIDGFRIFGEKIQPSTTHSIDLSHEKKCYSIAEAFLTDRRSLGLLYEIVF